MSDSLDDFFAKKDKKRGKDKGKFFAEALVRELEVGSKQVDYPVRKETKISTAIELLGLDADEADWRDFEDVEKRDYTGLKVKEMSLQDQNDEEQRRLISEQTEPMPETTPWRYKDDETAASSAKQKITTTSTTTAISTTDNVVTNPSSSQPGTTKSLTESNIEEKKKIHDPDAPDLTKKSGDKESVKPKVYVPPGQRNAAAGEIKLLEPVKLSKTKASSGGHSDTIPNIQDEELFPSLG